MARPTQRLIGDNVKTYLNAHENKSLLRFITCGSVDDGKSTLIGRLLYESHLLFDDQLDALEQDSKAHGTQNEKAQKEGKSAGIDFALLVDGLAAEREQGITIDVAYRYFSTDKRKFIVADTPGHEQYTRNMATAASTADLAILLIDARQGVLTQTRRHAVIASLLGVRSIVLAINKMDLVGYDEKIYNTIVEEFMGFAESLNFAHVEAIAVSALMGDNITDKSEAMAWYKGPALLPYLESVALPKQELEAAPFLMPVQWVNRPNADFRGLCGTIAAGKAQAGDEVRIIPGGQTTKIKEVLNARANSDNKGGELGDAITLTLADEIDASRGSILCDVGAPIETADQFEAHILWMAEDAMLPGRNYIFKSASQSAIATLNAPKHKLNINTLEHLPAKTLALNEIGLTTLSLNKRIGFVPYDENPTLGGFILIDRLTNNTVGAGMIGFALRRAANIHWQATEIDAQAQSRQKGQRPAILWFTGLSGSGKSTIANLLQKRLYGENLHSTILDGDNLRHGLNRDLGFTEADRVENIRRVAELSKLMLEAGLFALVSFISPFRAERRLARDLVQAGEFIEIHIATPLEVAEARDPKGLYKKARAGEIKNFTGLDSPYEPPEHAEITIDTTALSAEQAADMIFDYLVREGYTLHP